MSKRHVVGHSAEQQKDYERQARLQYGPDTVNESIRRWNNYSDAQQEAIQVEGGRIYEELADALEAGLSPESADVQALLARWHAHLRYFYEPTTDILRGLAELYTTSPDFMAFFRQYHADLPAYLQAGIIEYVDALETEEIERMLMEDATNRLSR